MFWYENVDVPVKSGDAWPEAQKKSFDGRASNVLLKFISGTGPVRISFTGYQLHGEIGGAGNVSQLFLKGFAAGGIYINSDNGDEYIQVWAWGD